MKKNNPMGNHLTEKVPIKHFLLIMRTAFILLFTCVFCSMAEMSYTQNARVTINKRNATLKEVLNEIEKQTDYLFIYNNEVNTNEKVSVRAKQKAVSEVLYSILENKDMNYSMEGNHILLSTVENVNSEEISSIITQQQKKQITGTVVDEAGIPVIGANIIERGTTNGTVTDIDGNFNLQVENNASIHVSYIGYLDQDINSTNQTRLNIVLTEDTKTLDEVVVVGFGTQKKVNLTGAVGTISAESIEGRPVANALQALQGQVPGLNISQTNGLLNSSPSMNIRGTGTIGSGSTAQPLVLIDGTEGNLEFVNPQDIENISVLKDAAASSIYGSRAPFGVILVTTKKGKAGQATVNYNNNLRWSAPTVRPKVMDSYTFATFMNDACVNSNTSAFITDERLQRIKDYVDGKITTVSIVDATNPQYWANGNSFGNANVDAYDFYYKDWAFSQEHNISASGGNDRFTFYTSLGFLDQNGLLDVADDSYQKFTPMGKIDAEITSWLKLNYTTRFIRTDYGRPTSLTSGLYANWARQNWPILPTHDDNGYIYRGSPLLYIEQGGKTNDQTDSYNNHGSLTMEPVKNWVTTVDLNYNIESYNQKSVSLKTYNHDVNGAPYINRQTSSVSNKWWKNNYLNLNVYSAYDFTLNQHHNFKMMAGLQYENLKYSTFGLSRAGVVVDDLPVVDLTSGLNYDGTVATPSVNGSMKEWSTAGYFGRLNYDYQGKYLAEVNLRYDGSSRFRSDNRWNWFPSFSAGWNIARENFWEPFSPIVNTLKLRGSYGNLGNQNTSNWYPTYEVLSVQTNAGTWLQNSVKPNVAYSPALISSTLTWEKINTWNVGVDAGAFNNRLTGAFDYYVRKTLDMVGPAIELPNILGKNPPRGNNTDLKTYGFELEIAWQDRLQNGLSYGAKLLLSDYQTEITKYPNTTNSLSTYYPGMKLGEIWGYETIGIAQSDEEMQNHLSSLPNGGQNAFGSQWTAGDIMYKDTNGDGMISAGSNTLGDYGDQRVIGNSTPRFQFGLDMNASWKGFDARIFLQGVAKRDYWSGTEAFFGSNKTNMWYIIGFTEHADYFRPEQSNDLPVNLDSYYPRPLLSNKNLRAQTRYLQNAAYIRLKNISVGYTLPIQITNKFHVNKLRLFFSGENLWTGTKLANMFDPEGIDGGHSNSGLGYPLQKTFSFGLSVTL